MPKQAELLMELLRALHRRTVECVLPVAREHDLSNAALFLLYQIQSEPGHTVSDLARRMEIAKSHVSNTVDLLERQGYVEKRPAPEDRRLVLLFPTAQSEALGQAILQKAYETLDNALREVPEDTITSLLESLRTVLGAFDRRSRE